jgi:MFS superfamily sulfate permease-like transporter
MVQGESGGKTALIGGFSSVILAVVILALSPLLETLPMACLAGIIIVNLKGLLLRVTDFVYYYRISMLEAVSLLNRIVKHFFITMSLLSYYSFFG